MLLLKFEAPRLFGPIEKSRVNHAVFFDFAPRQNLSYLVEMKLILKINDDSTNPLYALILGNGNYPAIMM